MRKALAAVAAAGIRALHGRAMTMPVGLRSADARRLETRDSLCRCGDGERRSYSAINHFITKTSWSSIIRRAIFM